MAHALLTNIIWRYKGVNNAAIRCTSSYISARCFSSDSILPPYLHRSLSALLQNNSATTPQAWREALDSILADSNHTVSDADIKSLFDGFLSQNNSESLNFLLSSLQAKKLRIPQEEYQRAIKFWKTAPNRTAEEYYAEAVKIYDALVAQGIVPKLAIITDVILAAARADDWSKVKAIMRQILASKVKPDVILYSSLMQVCAEQHKYGEIIQLFQAMIEGTIQPDSIAYSYIIGAYSNLSLHHKVLEIFTSTIEPQRIKLPLQSVTQIINALVEDRESRKAAEIYEHRANYIIERDLQGSELFTPLLDAVSRMYSHLRAPEPLENLLSQLKAAKITDIPENFYARLLRAHLRRDYQRGLSRLRELEAETKFSADFYGHIMNYLAERNDLATANSILQALKAQNVKPSIKSYNALLKLAVEARDWQRIHSIQREISAAQLAYDPFTYSLVLKTLPRAEVTAKIWAEVTEKQRNSLEWQREVSNSPFYGVLVRNWAKFHNWQAIEALIGGDLPALELYKKNSELLKAKQEQLFDNFSYFLAKNKLWHDVISVFHHTLTANSPNFLNFPLLKRYFEALIALKLPNQAWKSYQKLVKKGKPFNSWPLHSISTLFSAVTQGAPRFAQSRIAKIVGNYEDQGIISPIVYSNAILAMKAVEFTQNTEQSPETSQNSGKIAPEVVRLLGEFISKASGRLYTLRLESTERFARDSAIPAAIHGAFHLNQAAAQLRIHPQPLTFFSIVLVPSGFGETGEEFEANRRKVEEWLNAAIGENAAVTVAAGENEGPNKGLIEFQIPIQTIVKNFTPQYSAYKAQEQPAEQKDSGKLVEEKSAASATDAAVGESAFHSRRVFSPSVLKSFGSLKPATLNPAKASG
jgi:hypothetical protein